MEPPLWFPVPGPRIRLARSLAAALGLACGLLPAISAQSPSANSPYTFHVYEDLVQVPTLVLNSGEEPYPNLRENDFSIKLDGGPAFHPRHVRMEGEDPISLAVVADLGSKDLTSLAGQLGSAAATASKGWLTPRDRISIYAAGCSMVRTALDAPYSPEILDAGIQKAINSPLLNQRPADARGCTSDRLWDTLAGVIAQISSLPGRRVLLVLADGTDSRSSNTWKNLQIYAGRFSITIIGLQPVAPLLLLRPEFSGVEARRESQNIFELLCYATGGTTLSVQPETLAAQLQQAINLLRHRYILEFARPANGTSGMHAIQVGIPDLTAAVRPSGITYPMQDKTLTSAPNTLLSDPSRAPQLGNQKLLSHSQ